MHIKPVQAGPSTETMHGSCAGLKQTWNSKAVTLEICSTPKWNCSSKGRKLRRRNQITYGNMHCWWHAQHSLSEICFKKTVLLTVMEVAAGVCWFFFFFFWDMRYLRSRDNEKQEIAWRKDNTVISLAPLSLSSLNRLAAMSISSQGKSHSYDLFSSDYMTYPSLPLLMVFLPFTQTCPGNHEVLKSSTSVRCAEVSTSAHKDLAMNFKRAW